jgi:DNA polymerase III subunit delta'
MAFTDIIGQEKALALLQRALANNRLHHAYLFTGPEGVGKRSAAGMLAMALHCLEKRGDACGRCIECARIRNRNHPDIREVEPLPGKKEITIQQIRDMEKDLQFRSFSGGRKIAILDPAALLNQPSQNALLKTLEEPPQDSLLILISTSAGALLPTLRSRCLRVSFGPIPRELLAAFLISRKGMAVEEAQLLAALSMGSPGVALAMCGNERREVRREWGRRLAALSRGDYRAAMEFAEALASDRGESLEFLRWVQSWYRDLLAHRMGQKDLVNLDLLAELQLKAAELTPDMILSCAEQAADAAVKIHRNLNRRMVLEQLLFGAVGNH